MRRLTFSTARTRAGVIGIVRMRLPVASKNAFAIAAATGAVAGSPAPLERSSGRFRSVYVISGASL